MDDQGFDHVPVERVTTQVMNALTRREVEVLRWCAAGKTAVETGMILGLTCRTVNFHVSSAVRKMGVKNRTSAAVQAALGGVF
ncbi:helix-turn-helix domain-containing protein [Pseudomonas huanghezhanensis]|uniref:helix-turn-helix domain-containing protein n=1 Tax=Pseudomonas huanghezhanensis TaxID=3002903 RepID=UPI0038B69C2B